MSIATAILAAMVMGIPLASILELGLHKYFMHHEVWWCSYPYKKHAGIHHAVFGSDWTYHLQPDQDKWVITMAWWSLFVLVPLGTVPFALAALPVWYFIGWTEALTVVVTGATIIALYYGAYERLHYCMHAPKGRWFESSWVFRWLNSHHLLHHEDAEGSNYNVVIPLADWLFGALLLRARSAFAQVFGPYIFDVQPET